MDRTDAINLLWKRELIIVVILIIIGASALLVGGDLRVPISTFIMGNIGSYVSFHKSLLKMSDDEIRNLANSWIAIIVTPIIGGVLALVLYLLFLSGLIEGELFPGFEEDNEVGEGVSALFDQHAGDGFRDYAKLFFWSFFAGFKQKYVVNLIDSFKNKS